MNQQEIFQQASGLRKTAENRIRAGHGEEPVESIVRSAAEILVRVATQLNGHNPVLQTLSVYRGMTWLEIFSLAQTVCTFANPSEPRR